MGYVRVRGGATLAAGAGRPGTGNCSPTMCCHAGTRNSGDHTSTPAVAMFAGAAPHNTAGWVEDRRWTDKRSPTRTATTVPAAWVRGTRSSPTLADRIRKDVPAGDGDVRMGLAVGEGRQGEKTRRSGDACDSLYLWGTDVGDLARRTSGWDTGWTRAWNIRVVRAGGNWDLASAPTVAHALHRWPVGLVAYTWTARRVARGCLRCFVDEDMPCGPARRLAPVTRRA